MKWALLGGLCQRMSRTVRASDPTPKPGVGGSSPSTPATADKIPNGANAVATLANERCHPLFAKRSFRDYLHTNILSTSRLEKREECAILIRLTNRWCGV